MARDLFALPSDTVIKTAQASVPKPKAVVKTDMSKLSLGDRQTYYQKLAATGKDESGEQLPEGVGVAEMGRPFGDAYNAVMDAKARYNTSLLRYQNKQIPRVRQLMVVEPLSNFLVMDRKYALLLVKTLKYKVIWDSVFPDVILTQQVQDEDNRNYSTP